MIRMWLIKFWIWLEEIYKMKTGVADLEPLTFITISFSVTVIK